VQQVRNLSEENEQETFKDREMQSFEITNLYFILSKGNWKNVIQLI